MPASLFHKLDVFPLLHPPVQERRERLMKEQLEKMRADNPKITEQFADLKRDLAQVNDITHADCIRSARTAASPMLVQCLTVMLYQLRCKYILW